MKSAPYPWSKYAVPACLIITGIGVPLLFIPWDNSYHPRSLKLIWNFGHVPLFAAVSGMLMPYLKRSGIRIFELRLAILIILVLLAGIVIETLQFYAGRMFSIQDIYLDIIGACLVPAIIGPDSEVLFRYSITVLRLVVGVCLITALYPLGVSLLDEYHARRQFPLLAGFESRRELDRFGGGSRLQLTDYGLEVSFGTEKYSGFSLKYFPTDWRGYKYVNIDLHNPGSTIVDLTCRIHDQLHDQSYGDRYNQRFPLGPGRNLIKINLDDVALAPRNRKLDMKRIGGLGCFTISLPEPLILVIKKITLG